MDKIAILTDSASNLKENIKEGIFLVPLYVNLKAYSKKDLEEISPEELYKDMDSQVATTSAPSIDDYLNKIKLIKELGYNQIIAISLASELSGSYNSMRLALEMSDIDYKAIDSKTVTMGEGLLALYASKLVKDGLSLDDIEQKLLEKREEVKLFSVVSDLKYLIRGGRLKPLKGRIGSALKINPILTTDKEGKIRNHKLLRGKSRALRHMTKLVVENLREEEHYYLAIAYGENIEDIADIKENLTDIIDKADLYLEGPITAVLGAQAGPSVYVVSYLKI